MSPIEVITGKKLPKPTSRSANGFTPTQLTKHLAETGGQVPSRNLTDNKNVGSVASWSMICRIGSGQR
jgi:hypothetical protein